MMETLANAHTEHKMKALVVFRNVMGHMKKEAASSAALQLAKKLWQL